MAKAFRSLPVGGRIRWLRERAGESLQDLATATGRTRGHIWDLEQGRCDNPTLKTMLAICRHYDITIQKLLEGIQQ